MTDANDRALWKPRSVEETIVHYAKWAASYDADLIAWEYATPARIAAALSAHMSDKSAPILDYGCGTGFSGRALMAEGFATIDGTDVSPEMIEIARSRDVYRRLWRSEPGELDVARGTYPMITAIGVISAGAAPPEALRPVLGALAPGGCLAMSFNDETLINDAYMGELQAVQDDGTVRVIFEEYGDHLPKRNMKSSIYILEKT